VAAQRGGNVRVTLTQRISLWLVAPAIESEGVGALLKQQLDNLDAPLACSEM
jgi:hypothetical protein